MACAPMTPEPTAGAPVVPEECDSALTELGHLISTEETGERDLDGGDAIDLLLAATAAMHGHAQSGDAEGEAAEGEEPLEAVGPPAAAPFATARSGNSPRGPTSVYNTGSY